MLHSILFLGYIHASVYVPERIFGAGEMLERTKDAYPEPFYHYRNHVALRTPFSCFLELVSDNEALIIK